MGRGRAERRSNPIFSGRDEICEKKDVKVYIGEIGLQARAGSSENPQTWPAGPAWVIPFDYERSRASNQMGAAAIVGTFCGESITVLTQRQPTFARMHLVTHRGSSGAG